MTCDQSQVIPTGLWYSRHMAAGRARVESLNQLLIGGADELRIAVCDPALHRHYMHLDLLLAHRSRAGLTRMTDVREIAIKHFLDSLTCLLVRDIAAGEHVADVGSGAGFPGLVLAAARPEAWYVLIEANGRRAAFLREAVARLELDRVEVLAQRAEEIGQEAEFRERFDLAVSRAVAPLPALLEYCLPLVRMGGHFIALKGPAVVREIERGARALEVLGGRVAEQRRLSLPQGMGERVVVLVEKISPTPARYPRRPGRPTKRPL